MSEASVPGSADVMPKSETRPANELTDRELLIEAVTHLRTIDDLVSGFFGDLKSGKINPMQMIMGAMKR
jgi:hypothetical protein